MHFNRSFLNSMAAVVVSLTLPCCNNTPTKPSAINDTTNRTILKVASETTKMPSPDIDTSDFAIEYLTVADTGLSYDKLRKEMFDLHKLHGWPIDTMGRYYNTKKNEIVLSDTADDEIYRGEYFERRFPSESLSLEYFRSYSDSSSTKNIALVCGLYESKKSADSLLLILKQNAVHGFVQRAKRYMGCEH